MKLIQLAFPVIVGATIGTMPWFYLFLLTFGGGIDEDLGAIVTVGLIPSLLGCVFWTVAARRIGFRGIAAQIAIVVGPVVGFVIALYMAQYGDYLPKELEVLPFRAIIAMIQLLFDILGGAGAIVVAAVIANQARARQRRG